VEVSGEGKRALRVRPVGAEHSGIAGLSAHFSTFGTVTNVLLDTLASAAYVQMKTHEEAEASVEAWKRGMPVCGDAGIDVSWAMKEPGAPSDLPAEVKATLRGEGAGKPVEGGARVGNEAWKAAIYGVEGGRGGRGGRGGGRGGFGGGERERHGGAAAEGSAPAPAPVIKRESGLEAAKRVIDDRVAQSQGVAAAITAQKAAMADLASRKGSMSKEEVGAAMAALREAASRIKAQQQTLNASIKSATRSVGKLAATAVRHASGVEASTAGAGAGAGAGGGGAADLDGRDREAPPMLDDEPVGEGGGRRGDEEVDIVLEDD
jgi:hypothetical protein